MLDMAAFGNAIMFMVATMCEIIIGLYMAGYGAHCFLVVLEDTAAGIDEVLWPDEPLLDWLWKLLYLAWLVAFWLVPIWFLLGLLGPALLSQFPGLSFGHLVVGTVWLLFPVSLFSSLSANSLWVVFRPEVLRRLVQHLPAVLVVYVMTGALLIGWAWLAYTAEVSRFALVLLAAPAGGAVVLIYARLLGRLSWLLNYRTSERRKRRKPKSPALAERALAAEDPWAIPEAPRAAQPRKTKKKEPRKLEPRQKPEPKKQSVVEQSVSALYPWEVPLEPEEPKAPKEAEDEEFPSGPAQPYGLRDDEPPPPPPRSVSAHAEEHEPIRLQPLPDDTPAAKDEEPCQEQLADLTRVSDFEARLAGADRDPTPPAQPLWSGVYQFPWYPQSLGPWLWLTFGTLVIGALVKVQIAYWPL